MESFSFSLTVREVLGLAIFTPKLTLLGYKLLSAYASHKFTMFLNDGRFYKAYNINNPYMMTDRRLINFIIIRFEANFNVLDKSEEERYIFYEIDDNFDTELEYRRFINENHPLIKSNLKASCSDFSQLSFHNRVFEIFYDNYRLCMNPYQNTFTIQYKCPKEKHEVILTPAMTREILYVNSEGVVYKEPYFIVNKNIIIGLGTFLESNEFAVKTVYLKYNGIVLYQRVRPDNFQKSYPFILEFELGPMGYNQEMKYFNLGWRLNAQITNKMNDTNMNNFHSPRSKPRHNLKENVSRKTNDVYLKFDGIPSTLKFYRYHFVIHNFNNSNSFDHCLPEYVTYILRDYCFLVEARLYKSIHKYILPKPDPMVIIDIQTTTFDAFERMAIIKNLRDRVGCFLYDYFIFFQGEVCLGKEVQLNIPDQNFMRSQLRDGEIYEIVLDENYEQKIKYIIKHRKDKRKPNSKKLINIIKNLHSK